MVPLELVLPLASRGFRHRHRVAIRSQRRPPYQPIKQQEVLQTMVRTIAVVVLPAVIALPNGISASVLTQELGGVILSSSRSQDDHRVQPSSTSTTTTTTIKFIDELDKEVIIETTNYSDNTSSNPTTTNSTTTTAPTINPLSSSPPSPSPVATVTTTPPSKKYEPDDDEKKEGKKEEEEQKNEREPSIGMIFLWTIVTFGLLWMSCYFSDAIMFFVGNVSYISSELGDGDVQQLFISIFRDYSFAGSYFNCSLYFALGLDQHTSVRLSKRMPSTIVPVYIWQISIGSQR